MFGKNGMIDVAAVPLRTPPLMSKRALADLGIILNFADSTFDVRAAGKKDIPMMCNLTGHALIDIADFCEEATPQVFKLVGDAAPEKATPLSESGSTLTTSTRTRTATTWQRRRWGSMRRMSTLRDEY